MLVLVIVVLQKGRAEVNGVVDRNARAGDSSIAEGPSQPQVEMEHRSDDITDGELEAEFQWLCGGEDNSGTLKVCAQLEKAVKETYVRVSAEVARHMRTGNPNREAIETVARESLDETLGLVANLGVSAKRAAVAAAWTSVVLDSLE
ncbi:unnamed protein product, partial [Nippostrongylus brasiliensis]|uniref:Uncharacterized protein n=1 Tax=Nippostrongylus brasiliensis TaxID=27835 RepID=A0A0N4YZ77_NIPBR